MTSSSIDLKKFIIQIQCRSLSDPHHSDIDLKKNWLGFELPLIFQSLYYDDVKVMLLRDELLL